MIKDFTDLRVWQAYRELSVMIYRVTEQFPKSEQFGLVSQMRRAAISVSSNIAEGFGRKSTKDQEHFYVMASGSLFEVKNQLIIAGDLGFIKGDEANIVFEKIDATHKQLNALLKVHRGSNV